MAQQLAAQEYLTRLQTAARDPTAYAALAAQGILPNYEMLSQGSKGRSKNTSTTSISSAKTSNSLSTSLNIPQTNSSKGMLDHLRLPSDTEIIKYTSDTGSKHSTSLNSKQRRKKDSGHRISSPISTSTPVIPPGTLNYIEILKMAFILYLDAINLLQGYAFLIQD